MDSIIYYNKSQHFYQYHTNFFKFLCIAQIKLTLVYNKYAYSIIRNRHKSQYGSENLLSFDYIFLNINNSTA